MDKLQQSCFKIFETELKTGNKEVKKLLAKYKKSQNELIEKVSSIVIENLSDDGTLVQGAYTIEIKERVEKELESLAKETESFTDDLLRIAYKDTYIQTAGEFGITISWDIVREEVLKAALNYKTSGLRYSQRIWNNTDDLANDLYNEILNCVRTGKRPNAIAAEIRKKYGVGAYEAKRLVNTELARVVNQGQLDYYKSSDVVQSVMWCATLDLATCPTCGGMDGKVYDKRNAPNPIQHPSCRCCFIPVTDGWKPTERADNMTKTNTSYKTYDEWARGL